MEGKLSIWTPVLPGSGLFVFQYMDTKLKYLYAATFAAILIAGSGWFYWFEYLPAKTERDCSDYLLERSIINKDSDFYNKYFKACINSGGSENFKNVAKEAIEQRDEEEASEQPEEMQRPALIVPVSSSE